MNAMSADRMTPDPILSEDLCDADGVDACPETPGGVRDALQALVAVLREYGSFPPKVVPALLAAERALGVDACPETPEQKRQIEAARERLESVPQHLRALLPCTPGVGGKHGQ